MLETATCVYDGNPARFCARLPASDTVRMFNPSRNQRLAQLAEGIGKVRVSIMHRLFLRDAGAALTDEPIPRQALNRQLHAQHGVLRGQRKWRFRIVS